MRKLLYPLFFLCIILTTYAQKEANIWYFGQNAGINFNTTPPTALTNGKLNTTEGCSSFADTNGNLLFYSDGIDVYNKNHELMRYSNGNPANNLEGNPSSTQSGMIIPKPGSTSIYYLFTVGTDFVPNGSTENPGFNYYTIDMSRNNGLGEITAGPINLAINANGQDISWDWSEKVAAVKGKECNTFWVVSFVIDTFYAYKVDVNGVNTTNVVRSRVQFSTSDKRGYLQFSPDGKKLAFADHKSRGSNFIRGSLQLFDFDNATGIVDANSETQLIADATGESPYGVAFSQNSTKLYTSSFRGNNNYTVYQFDLEVNDIPSSRTRIINRSGYRGALQLAPNGKIYASIPGNTTLDAIENPNANAGDIVYTQDAINLNGRIATQGLPPFIASLLLPIEIKNEDTSEAVTGKTLQYCIGDSKKIAPDPVSGKNIKYEWTFTNQTGNITTVSNTRVLEITNMKLTDTGLYQLIVTLTDDCGNEVTQEGEFTLEVYHPTKANTVTNISFCDEDKDGFNEFDFQKNVTPQVLRNQDPAIFEVVYYTSLQDATSNTTANALTNPYTNPTAFSTQTIYARIHNKLAPNACYDITTFTLAVTGKPTPKKPEDYGICDNTSVGSDTDGFIADFLLSSKDSEILNGLDPNIYTISYHTTLADANTSSTSNPIDKNNPYTNIKAHTQPIYVRVENKNNTACNDTSVTFNLVVNALPTISSSVTLEQCDTDADLNTTINLSLAEGSISNNSANETFSYYPTLNNAINNTAIITNTKAHPVSNGSKVWARAISNEGCYRIAEINIAVGFSKNINYNKTFEVCDDFLDKDGNDTANNSNTDGITYFDLSEIETDIKKEFPVANQNNLKILVFETSANRDAVENPISDLAKYRNTNIPAPNTPQTLYIKILDKNNNNCQGIASCTIITRPIPSFTVNPTAFLCQGNSITLEALNPAATYNYLWYSKEDPTNILGNNSTYVATKGGIYYVESTGQNNANCSYTQEIVVTESSAPLLSLKDIEITDDTNNGNSSSYAININNKNNNLGIGSYQFSLKKENEIASAYQDSPIFENLSGGIYTIAVQDKNGCNPIATLEVALIEYPKFFTPNNDGENDVWRIKGATSKFYPNSKILIFDRYGKVVANLPIDSLGWDGTYNGKIVPSSDYWFKIELIDTNGNAHQHQGHFSLLRN